MRTNPIAAPPDVVLISFGASSGGSDDPVSARFSLFYQHFGMFRIILLDHRKLPC
jgi:hypothetical protein